MAKVYDALKRIETERTRQMAARPMVPPLDPTPSISAALWTRWFGKDSALHLGSGASGAADDPVGDRIRMIASRLDALEASTGTRAPHVDGRFQDLAEKVEGLEHDLAKRICDISAQLTRTTVQLRLCTWLLFGLVGFALAAFLLHA